LFLADFSAGFKLLDLEKNLQFEATP